MTDSTPLQKSMQHQFPELAELHSLVRGPATSSAPVGFRFAPEQPVHVARAPGRLDLMGGIADYSGALVLQLPTREATYAACQLTERPTIQLASRIAGTSIVRTANVTLDQFRHWVSLPYADIRSILAARTEEKWSAYPLGVLIVLAKQRGWTLTQGIRLLFYSSVPEAKGVSSSAALEVATLSVLLRATGQTLSGEEIAQVCQFAENQVVGAPCGIMDQMTAALGRSGQLLALLCQPAEVQGYVELPPEIGVWGIDSGIRHAVSGSDYSAVRTGAFMGYRIIADLAKLAVRRAGAPGVVEIDDPRWHGCLANIAPGEFEEQFAAQLPLEMKGSTFLRRYQGITDTVTRVASKQTYAIRFPTAHPVHENARVHRFAELLKRPGDLRVLTELGQLMYGSHYSYSRCGLGSVGTDRLVRMVQDAGTRQGLYGAKITGGGSGGTVAVLGRADAGAVVHSIAERYARATGHAAYVFEGSSIGATDFPTLTF